MRAGVESDFVILSDPQYYCFEHIEFLSSPSSILLTEIAAHPEVFNFKCRERVLFSSMFPVGAYFEARLGIKGVLRAGGSVATSAWDFARYSGAREIFIAGMDLGFPGSATHIAGSSFEEGLNRSSVRTCPAEIGSVRYLMSASPYYARDVCGRPLLSDEKMRLFAWWFETNALLARERGIATFTLTDESLGIRESSARTLKTS